MTIYDSKAGAARRSTEQGRMAAILARAMPPEGCGPAIPIAPARGPQLAFMPRSMVPDGTEDGWVEADTGWAGLRASQAADVFDRMLAAARRAKRPATLTPGQIAMARRYRALVEMLSTDGTKLSRLDAGCGGDDGGDWMDRRMGFSGELMMLRRRIGTGAAMAVRRIRPSERGTEPRVVILDRVLVDMIALKDCTLDQVLLAHGWKKNARTHKAIAEGLCCALDRMIGYRTEKSS